MARPSRSRKRDTASFRKVLENARRAAKGQRGYDSEATRHSLAEVFKKAHPTKDPFDWQLDISEAIVLGLDSILIAGTGAGKTYPMIMAQLLPENKEKFTLIISPLNALQEDQVCFSSRLIFSRRGAYTPGLVVTICV